MGKYLELVCEDGWEYVRRINCDGSVIVLVYDVDREAYLMVEQFRPPVKRRVLEFPAGLIDSGETPIQTAVRELYEETGVVVTADDLINLGSIYSGVGITSEEVSIFAVEINEETVIEKPDLQGSEIGHDLKNVWLKEENLYQLKAAKVLGVFLKYKAYRDLGIRY